jgi:hypothetical protein
MTVTTTTPMTDLPASPAAAAEGAAGLSSRTRAAIVVAPIAITVACLALCVPPAGRRFYDWVISENKPVEMATFVLALAAAIMAVRLALVLIRRAAAPFAGVFYVLFALGMFFIGMEEISWGQQIFGWETPPDWGQANAQNETTLHNLGPFQGKNDILRFGFGFGGLIGVALAAVLPPRFRVLFPHRALVSWFLIIAGVSAAQVYVDLAPSGPLAGPLGKLGRLAEVVEMLISIAAVLYLWINLRLVRRGTSAIVANG